MLLSIEKLIYGGDGLARVAAESSDRSIPVFVPFVMPGERVEADIIQQKPGLARASVTRVVEPAGDRVEARCPYFQQCGGCHYQHIPCARQLEFKADILRETLRRIAKIEPPEIHAHASAPWNYRNRVRLRVQTPPEFALGYLRFGLHEFLPVRDCPIASPLINRILARLLELRGLDCPSSVEEIELFADAEDEHLLAWAFCRPGMELNSNADGLLRWSEALTRELPEIVGMTFFPSRHRSGKVADEDDARSTKARAQLGAKALRYRTQHHNYQVSAGSFFQVNRFLIDDLVSVVAGNAGGELALDFYAGVGLFSNALAKSFRHIFAVEASLTSYGDLVQNVTAGVKALGARTEDYLGSDILRGRLARTRPDLIVVDPPRAGLGKAVVRSFVQIKAPRLRYVSCDPATMARDIVPLLASGYRIEEAHLFDLFPQTFHIESVMLLAR